MDVLAPDIGEIIGGSQREERLDVLDRRMEEMHLDQKAYWWYRDLRRYGTVPEGSKMQPHRRRDRRREGKGRKPALTSS